MYFRLCQPLLRLWGMGPSSLCVFVQPAAWFVGVCRRARRVNDAIELGVDGSMNPVFGRSNECNCMQAMQPVNIVITGSNEHNVNLISACSCWISGWSAAHRNRRYDFLNRYFVVYGQELTPLDLGLWVVLTPDEWLINSHLFRTMCSIMASSCRHGSRHTIQSIRHSPLLCH